MENFIISDSQMTNIYADTDSIFYKEDGEFEKRHGAFDTLEEAVEFCNRHNLTTDEDDITIYNLKPDILVGFTIVAIYDDQGRELTKGAWMA